MVAQALNAKSSMVVGSADVVWPSDAESMTGSFNIGNLPEGEYRLCFLFKDFAVSRSFYREPVASDPAGSGSLDPQRWEQLCFEEGTVIHVAADASSQVMAMVGRHCMAFSTGSDFYIPCSVRDTAGTPIPGIKVEFLAACSAEVIGNATTGQDGAAAVGGHGTSVKKVRLSDPAGRFKTIFYGAEDEDFLAGSLVQSSEAIVAVMAPAQPHIEVAPQAVNFGNVQLPGSATALVTIQNIGTADLVVSGLTLGAGSSPCISLQSVPVLPLTLTPDASCEVTVAFEPKTLDAAGATLLVMSSDPNQAVVKVALSGQGVASEAPPAEQVAVTLEFIQDSAAEGTLQGTGPAEAAGAHMQALLNQIKAASDLAAAGKLTQACQQLQNAMQRTDGDPQPPDFVIGSAAAELRLLIELTRQAIGCR